MNNLRIIITIFPILLLISCENTVSKTDLNLSDPNVKYGIEKQVMYDGAPYTGYVIELWSNGENREKTHFKDGYLEGPRKFWRKDGSLEKEGAFLGGKREGKYSEFREDGSLRDRSIYQNDEIIDKSRYWPNGELYVLFPYSNGEINGEVVEYYESGIVHKRLIYKNGKETGELKKYFPSGELEYKVVPRGRANQFIVFRYYESGIISNVSGRYGKDHSGWNFNFFENEKPSGLSYFYDGQKNGIFLEWNESGNTVERGQFSENRQIGTWEYYNTEGEKIRSEEYSSSGKLLRTKNVPVEKKQSNKNRPNKKMVQFTEDWNKYIKNHNLEGFKSLFRSDTIREEAFERGTLYEYPPHIGAGLEKRIKGIAEGWIFPSIKAITSQQDLEKEFMSFEFNNDDYRNAYTMLEISDWDLNKSSLYNIENGNSFNFTFGIGAYGGIIFGATLMNDSFKVGYIQMH